MRPPAAGGATALALLVIYLLTLAPGLTFWDAGELIAAVETLGIPHPPGTPLWVLIARAWSDALGMLPRSLATNALSAVAVAAATGVLAMLVARWTRRVLVGIGAGLCAGSMSTVWLNATETEVYAVVLLLAALMLYAGDRAGETGDSRWSALLAYLFALAVPLHLSALVAAPAALVLAAQRPDGAWRWRTGALLGAVLLGVAGVGTVSTPLLVAAVLSTILAVMGAERPSRALLAIGAVVIALSALAVIPMRAMYDPWLNTQNATDWGSLWELVGRRQYGEQPLWPRRAPVWAQLAMLPQYADWQVALGLNPGIVPSVGRTAFALAFVVLSVVGARWHRRVHPRSWRALLVLLLAGTVGLVVYLNFRAGPTMGHGLLPPDTQHEARERDYFFLLGFWCWGAWAGIGAMHVAGMWRRLPAAGAGLVLAALPIALNWGAVDRSAQPEASLPQLVARALLEPLPEGAVLVTFGDNDTYPAWHAQTVERARPDVVVVASPMLNARWYREELARRERLLRPGIAADPSTGELTALREIMEQAGEQGRPFLLASTGGVAQRRRLRADWTLTGFWLRPGAGHLLLTDGGPHVDSSALAEVVRRYPAPAADRVRSGTDPTPRALRKWLDCPTQTLATTRHELHVDSLATPCKLW